MPLDDTGIRKGVPSSADDRASAPAIPPDRLKRVAKGLRTLHTLELMAVNIYQYQITREPSEHNRALIAAMANEMTHLQDFQVKLYELGLRPNPFRWAYGIAGWCFGTFSRLGGRRAILETGIWVETKAVHHYAQLLATIDWDEETRRIVEKNQADERAHIARWRSLLG